MFDPTPIEWTIGERHEALEGVVGDGQFPDMSPEAFELGFRAAQFDQPFDSPFNYECLTRSWEAGYLVSAYLSGKNSESMAYFDCPYNMHSLFLAWCRGLDESRTDIRAKKYQRKRMEWHKVGF